MGLLWPLVRRARTLRTRLHGKPPVYKSCRYPCRYPHLFPDGKAPLSVQEVADQRAVSPPCDSRGWSEPCEGWPRKRRPGFLKRPERPTLRPNVVLRVTGPALTGRWDSLAVPTWGYALCAPPQAFTLGAFSPGARQSAIPSPRHGRDLRVAGSKEAMVSQPSHRDLAGAAENPALKCGVLSMAPPGPRIQPHGETVAYFTCVPVRCGRGRRGRRGFSPGRCP